MFKIHFIFHHDFHFFCKKRFITVQAFSESIVNIMHPIIMSLVEPSVLEKYPELVSLFLERQYFAF